MSESAADAEKVKRKWNAGQWKATALMYPSYAAAIFGRTAMDAAMPAMLLDPANAFTAADTATLLSTGVAFYSVGKIVGGAAADKTRTTAPSHGTAWSSMPACHAAGGARRLHTLSPWLARAARAPSCWPPSRRRR